MIDLETLIANKQDALRGRPRDWIDDFKDWRATIEWDWVSVAIWCCAVIWFASIMTMVLAP